jgi:trehalose-6-phosphate synthase
VLVLSRFAGAAHELDAALIVNPYDTDATAAAIRRALEMPLDERKGRWNAMMAHLEKNTVERWCSDFLASLVGGGCDRAAADHHEGLAPLSTELRKPRPLPQWGSAKI